ncbi:flagella biosynthesis regulatory protein FliZ [Candidatus Borreliella tachyglossi]|uniref:flagella biosynthesis regulatory protein FliZ n=1 Tax=Candidatus Borreliella tachyglossi TaxID=1964448 RepID=UPI004041DD70
MSRLTSFNLLFLIFITFFSKNLFAQKDGVTLDSTPSSLESEIDLPILGDDKVDLNSDDIRKLSLFNIADLVNILLFCIFFIFCIFLFKRMIFSRKILKNDRQSNFIRELAFYEIDNKNSIRIINILGNIYVFLVSINSSILLREIKQGEELDKLEFELDKVKGLGSTKSFRAIFYKILRKSKEDESLPDEVEYTELEKDIETSLKSKQDRLKKF